MKISIALNFLKAEKEFRARPHNLTAWMNDAFPDIAATGQTWRHRLDDAKELIDEYKKQLELDLQERFPARSASSPPTIANAAHTSDDDLDDDWDEDGPTN